MSVPVVIVTTVVVVDVGAWDSLSGRRFLRSVAVPSVISEEEGTTVERGRGSGRGVTDS